MAGASDLLGGADAIRQILLWQVAGQLIAPVLAPVANAIAMRVWEGATSAGGGIVSVPLSPAEAALGVIKGTIDAGTGASIAGKNGIDGADFARLVANTGEPISTQELLFLLRRGRIDQATLEHGVRQGRVRDEWIPAILALATQPIAAAEAVAAVVQNQIPHAQGQQIAYENGLEAADFQILVDTHGRPPGPSELLEMVRRGIIPQAGTGPAVLSLQQGISESDVKDKWIPIYNALLEYLPPPRTVTALLHAGSITQPQALDLFKKAGLSQELAAAYVANASHTKVATEKALAKTTVVELYTAKLVDKPTAVAMLEKLGYVAAEAAFLLELADLQHHLTSLRSATTRIGNLYITRKLERAAAAAALDSLGVPADQRDQLIITWQLERAASLKILSETAIASAWKYQLISDDEALSQIEAHGYTPHDAWIFLAIHNTGTGPGAMPARDTVHGNL